MSQPSTPPAEKPPHADHGEPGVPTDLKPPSGISIIIAVVGFVVVLVALFLIGYIPDHREEMQVRHEAEERSKQLPVVQVTKTVAGTGTHEVILPCDVKANQSTAIFTRTSGYLDKWNFDIGQHVEQGQLMAVIATPEVDAQLAQSQATVGQDQANVKRAAADLDLARTTYNRYTESAKKSAGSVTQEDLDTRKSAVDDAVAALEQAQETVKAAEANVKQLQTLVNFEKVVAPFSGTVTARNYDVGALLSPTGGKEIFDLSQTDPLRVFVNVPQSYANDVKVNEEAKLYLRNFPAHAFIGTVALTAGAVDPNTRTLSVQINFPNKDGKLLVGEYGEIHLPVKDPETVGQIPTSALIFNSQSTGLQVAIVDAEHKIHMKKIKTGRDFGTTIEVVEGVTADDRIVTNPSERVNDGVLVKDLDAPPGLIPAPVGATTQPATTQPR